MSCGRPLSVGIATGAGFPDSSAIRSVSLITARGWGIAVGIPLSVLVQVATAMGKYKEALGHLCTPVPDALFSSPLGLPYLLARGRYYFAREDFGAALRDFGSIADLLAPHAIRRAELLKASAPASRPRGKRGKPEPPTPSPVAGTW